jgi:hypothetical protein
MFFQVMSGAKICHGFKNGKIIGQKWALEKQ